MTSNRIRSLALLLVSITLLSPALARQKKDFSKTIAFDSGGELKINSTKGTVKLTGWDRNEVEIVAQIVMTGRVDADYARRAVEAVRIDVAGDSRQLSIKAVYDDVPRDDNIFGRTIPDVNFEIRAPRRVSLLLDTDRGRLELQGLEGRLNVRSDRGSVMARNLAGDLRLSLDRCPDSALSGLRGTFHVDMDRSDLKFSALQIIGDSRLEVSRGEAEVRLPRSQGLSVSANSGRRADFDTDFAISTRKFGERIEGDINGGGPKLLIHTDRGKVELRSE